MLSIRVPDDFHLHLRTGQMLSNILPYSAKHFARAIIMPNVPAICNAEDLAIYRHEILSAQTGLSFILEPLMTIKIDAKTTPDHIVCAEKSGAIAGKLYPDGVTTGSAGGVSDFDLIFPLFEALQSENMVACLHGELPGAFSLDREVLFFSILDRLAKNFPRLRIVLEHISTSEAVEIVRKYPNVFATVTAHHLVDDLDAIIGSLLNPHSFCKPIPKYPKDRAALRKAVTSGDPKFFFGSDSAPHPQEKKECARACAGCFTAPTAMATLAEVFEDEGALDKLENFVSKFGADVYQLPYNKGTLILEKREWTVDSIIGNVVPWRAGEKPRWQVVGRTQELM